MNLKNKTILVTGGAGFIGSNLCDVLCQSDFRKLYILDDLCQSNLSNIDHLQKDKDHRISFVYGDVKDADVVTPLVLESDYVFHLAASDIGHSEISSKIDMETNIIGTLNILEAARKNPKVRIVHASSGSVIGSSDELADEEAILRPTTLYGISKMTGEKYAQFYAREYGVKVSIIRYFHVFGPRQNWRGKAGVVNIFLSRILKGLPPVIWGSGEQIKCFTYVMDAVSATLLLAKEDGAIGQIYNVASDTRINIKDLAELLIEKYSEDKNMIPIYSAPKMGENMNPNPDVSKIKELGFRAKYDFHAALEVTKSWVEENIWI